MGDKQWNAHTSKWKAALDKGMKMKMKGSENILYLGASSGTTVGQVSKRTKGIIFAVEKSIKMAIPLINLSESKKNIAPLFCDAQNINYIKENIEGTEIDILFQDIPSTNQINILNKNTALIKDDAKIFLSLKTQSISQEDPRVTLKKTIKQLEKYYEILDVKSLSPFQKKHYFFILKKNKIIGPMMKNLTTAAEGK